MQRQPLPTLTIDAHQHFWKYNAESYGWINDKMKIIRRDFLPEDLLEELKGNQLDGSVAIQADQTETETQFLLNLAQQHPWIQGVVGWVDLRAPTIKERLSHFSKFKKLKGFRHVVQDEPNGFLLQKEFIEGIRLLRDYHLTYDILVYARQLDEVVNFVKLFPDQPFVIDHIAKPAIRAGALDDWQRQMTAIAAFENVYCKLSGMVTEADWQTWKQEDLDPYLDVVLRLFGPKRLMYGSDWPVCLVSGTYSQQLQVVRHFIEKLSADEKQLIMGKNAIQFYNL